MHGVLQQDAALAEAQFPLQLLRNFLVWRVREEVMDLSTTFDRPHDEVTGKSGAPDHLDMLRSVVSVDKLATSYVVSL